jgi:putative membrane protein
MMELTTLIARPLIGAVIGYITNDIAIRMLFRPRTAKYIFGVKIPFTPGLIPKEKSRIASSLGNAISKNLMNTETLEKTLLSQEMLDKIGSSFDSFIHSQKVNSETVEQFLSHYLKNEDIEYLKASVSNDLSSQIHTALANSQLGDKVAHIAVEHVMTKVKNGMLGMFGTDQFLALVAVLAESLLAKNINEMLSNHSKEMVGTLIGDQIQSFMTVPMKKLFVGREKAIEKAKVSLLSLYRTLVTEQLPRILEAVNISKIVESRINEMDVKESERLILEVMNKELKAIVWLGALLGFMMGCINLLF